MLPAVAAPCLPHPSALTSSPFEPLCAKVVASLIINCTHLGAVGRPRPWVENPGVRAALGDFPTEVLMWSAYACNVATETLAVVLLTHCIFWRLALGAHNTYAPPGLKAWSTTVHALKVHALVTVDQRSCPCYDRVMQKVVLIHENRVVDNVNRLAIFVLTLLIIVISLGGILAHISYGFFAPIALLSLPYGTMTVGASLFRTLLELHSQARRTVRTRASKPAGPKAHEHCTEHGHAHEPEHAPHHHHDHDHAHGKAPLEA